MISSKHILILLFSVISAVLFAQKKEITGKIIDKSTQTGIEGVVVSDLSLNESVLTNKEGKYVINISEKEDGLLLNHINYKAIKVDLANSKSIELEPITNELEEIVVFKKSLKDTFGPALLAMHNSLKKGELYKTYMREFNIINRNTVNVADGLVDFYIAKPGKKAVVDIREHRAFISKEEFYKDETLEESLSVVGSGDLRNFLNSITDTETILKIIKDKKKYQIVTKMQRGVDNQNRIVLEFDSSDKTEYYYKGYVVFDEDRTKVLAYKIEYFANQKPLQKSLLGLIKMKVWNLERHIVFNQSEKGTQLKYGVVRVNFDLKIVGKAEMNLDFTRDIIVDQVILDAPMLDPKTHPYIELYSNKSNYKTEFWKNRNIRPLTIKEEAILRDLEKKALKQ